jgi:hypothetical protein
VIDELQILVRNGQLRQEHIFNANIADGWNTPPGTYLPMKLEKKNLLRSYIAQGLLPGVSQKDIAHFTDAEADFYIECAEANRWTGPKRYADYLIQTDKDIAPADSGQIDEIIGLGRDGFLNPLPSKTLLSITHLSADRLIWRGKRNKREGKYVVEVKISSDDCHGFYWLVILLPYCNILSFASGKVSMKVCIGVLP